MNGQIFLSTLHAKGSWGKCLGARKPRVKETKPSLTSKRSTYCIPGSIPLNILSKSYMGPPFILGRGRRDGWGGEGTGAYSSALPPFLLFFFQALETVPGAELSGPQDGNKHDLNNPRLTAPEDRQENYPLEKGTSEHVTRGIRVHQ